MPSRCASTGTRASFCTRSTRPLPPRGTIMSIEAGRTQHGADRFAVLRRHQLDRLGRDAGRDEPFDQRGMDRAVRMDRLAAAAQQHGIAAAKAQRGGVGGDVGAAFVDDPDQPDRDAHAASSSSPLGTMLPVDDLADRIGQRRDRLDRARPRLRGALVVEPQAIEQRGGQAVGFARGDGPGGWRRGSCGAAR